MMDGLARRGPDGSGLTRWTTATLGHRRLAIFDLSERGKQPMLSDDGSIGIVFNGAIYNFPELRRQLEAHGFSFKSATDTEVLLNGYRHWGIEELARRAVGMFAFAIWDDRSRELFLVRDRLGVKPLVYSIRGETLGFASTERALRSAGFGGELNDQAVIDYLEWGVVPEQRTIYGGCEKLPPASIGKWSEGRFSLHRYWKPPRAEPSSAISFDEAVERTEEMLLTAVRRRTQADVPVGALLSGGIDSALVCWALREIGSDVQCFTYAARGQPQDESTDAGLTAREIGIPVTVLEMNEVQDEWEDFREAYAEPFACGSAIGMLRLSRAAKEAVTVLITGDGGDDVFLGYPQHRFLRTAQRLARLAPPGLHAGPPAGPGGSGLIRRARNFTGYVLGGLGAFLRARPQARFFETNGLLGTRLQDLRPASQQLGDVPGSGRSVLDDYLEYAREHQFVDEYLTKVDGATMYYGLEARSPFLDHELWEYAAALPYSLRLHRGTLKAVLRELARRRISARVASGRKRGFEVPLGFWLKGKWQQRTDELLTDSLLSAGGWLNTGKLLKLVRQGAVPDLNLWYAVVLEMWLRREASSGAQVRAA